MKILDSHDRRGLARTTAAAMALLALVAVAPIASVRILAQGTNKVTLRGVVSDPSGARVPKAKVSILPANSTANPRAVVATTESGADGAYVIELPPIIKSGW